MRYIPVTSQEKEAMLAAIGAKSMEELFSDIPKEYRLQKTDFDIDAVPEMELVAHMKKTAVKETEAANFSSFLGGGIYRHYRPAFIDAIVSRQEFLTAYTPYQPEVAQGTLQALYEFQTHIALLSGMDVASASLYDGATATVEAVMMARRINKNGNKVFVSRSLHPHYRAVLKNYLRDVGIRMVELPFNTETGRTIFCSKKFEDAFCFVTPYPNYFGVIENLAKAREVATASGALLVSVTAEPLSLALLKPPGEYGVDIFVGEGQSFGLSPNFGGPLLGLIATKNEHVRNLPGRLIGKGKDADGKDAYLIVIATREQHIRREKATSNICTNETNCAIAAGMYLSAYGKNGLPELAKQNVERVKLAKELLSEVKGVSFPLSGYSFNEFVIRTPLVAAAVLRSLVEKKIFAGIDLSKNYPEYQHDILVSVTEMNTRDEIYALQKALREVLS